MTITWRRELSQLPKRRIIYSLNTMGDIQHSTNYCHKPLGNHKSNTVKLIAMQEHCVQP